MKKYFAALALAAALAQPASATTFPTLTTIYVGTGVRDAAGVHTAFLCSNVSGLTAGIRIVALAGNGTVAGSYQLLTVPHGALLTVVTSSTGLFPGADMGIDTVQGTVNIESKESGVFCTAFVLHVSTTPEFMAPLNLVRVNPHPGTVE